MSTSSDLKAQEEELDAALAAAWGLGMVPPSAAAVMNQVLTIVPMKENYTLVGLVADIQSRKLDRNMFHGEQIMAFVLAVRADYQASAAMVAGIILQISERGDDEERKMTIQWYVMAYLAARDKQALVDEIGRTGIVPMVQYTKQRVEIKSWGQFLTGLLASLFKRSTAKDWREARLKWQNLKCGQGLDKMLGEEQILFNNMIMLASLYDVPVPTEIERSDNLLFKLERKITNKYAEYCASAEIDPDLLCYADHVRNLRKLQRQLDTRFQWQGDHDATSDTSSECSISISECVPDKGPPYVKTEVDNSTKAQMDSLAYQQFKHPKLVMKSDPLVQPVVSAPTTTSHAQPSELEPKHDYNFRSRKVAAPVNHHSLVAIQRCEDTASEEEEDEDEESDAEEYQCYLIGTQEVSNEQAFDNKTDQLRPVELDPDKNLRRQELYKPFEGDGRSDEDKWGLPVDQFPMAFCRDTDTSHAEDQDWADCSFWNDSGGNNICKENFAPKPADTGWTCKNGEVQKVMNFSHKVGKFRKKKKKK